MNTKSQHRVLFVCAVVLNLIATAVRLPAQSFSSYHIGDDLTTSLGQFQLVLDPAWRPIFDLIMPNSPLGSTLVTHHLRLYHNGVITSPTLYDPATMIGRSESFVSGGPEEADGTLAGRPPGRTYVRDSQIVTWPSWANTNGNVREIHTFLKSMHLTDSFTTRIGFSVKAGMQAPTRPVCPGQVEGGSVDSDFPARSFFNVYVVVDLPAGGLLPAIQLVNVEPLLVQQTNVAYFPPHLVYQHENSTAVSMYFNQDCTIIDPLSNTPIYVTRGTLFGQLTLAGHGIGFSQVETEAFQNEIENESATSSMPVNPIPTTTVQIQDFSPDYNALPPAPAMLGSRFMPDGSFAFKVSHLTVNTTNRLQVCTSIAAGDWQTIATIVPSTNTLTVLDADAVGHQQRFYRLVSP
jgi:hypothetical protein